MNTAPIAAALNLTEELRSTMGRALKPAQPHYTVGDHALLAAASVLGERAYRRMEHAINQQHVPGVIADLDRFAHDLRLELGDAYREDGVQRETAEVYIV